MEKNKKIFIAVAAIALVIIAAGGYYFYKIKNNNNLPFNTEIISGYPELTDEIIIKMGGRKIVDGLIAKFEASKNNLDSAIKKYEEGGKKDEDKPGVILFSEVAKYSQYLKKYDLAIRTLESVFIYHDKSEVALLNLAHVYEGMGENRKAVDTYLRFQAMYPSVAIDQYYVDLMQNYITLGDKEKVIALYDQYAKAGFKSEEIEQYISRM